MIRLLLVRHGQTAWSAERRYQGSTDVPLNDTGLRQAAALGVHFTADKIDAIYSSTLQRALQTAAAISRTSGVAVIPEPRFRETSFGEWEGKTYSDLQAQWADHLTAWRLDPMTNTPPGGESLAQLLQRAGEGVRDIEQKHHDETVMIVAHGGVLRALICYALNLPSTTFWRIELGSASISELHLYGDTTTISLLNDRHPLGGMAIEQSN
jgi:alpha-ribazole phosphatase